MRLDIRSDIRGVELSLGRLPYEIREQAIARALNRAATSVRADAARRISAELGRPFTVGEVRKRMGIRRANAAVLVAVVTVHGAKNLPLSAFPVRQTRTGVTARVGGKTVRIAHAFIAAKGSKRKAVYLRADDFRGRQYTADLTSRRGPGSGRKGRKWGDPDFPVAEVLAPGIPTPFQQSRIRDAYARVAQERFRTALAQETRFRFSTGRF